MIGEFSFACLISFIRYLSAKWRKKRIHEYWLRANLAAIELSIQTHDEHTVEHESRHKRGASERSGPNCKKTKTDGTRTFRSIASTRRKYWVSHCSVGAVESLQTGLVAFPQSTNLFIVCVCVCVAVRRAEQELCNERKEWQWNCKKGPAKTPAASSSIIHYSLRQWWVVTMSIAEGWVETGSAHRILFSFLRACVCGKVAGSCVGFRESNKHHLNANNTNGDLYIYRYHTHTHAREHTLSYSRPLVLHHSLIKYSKEQRQK